MSEAEMNVLLKLNQCPKKKGLILEGAERRAANALKKQKLVDWLEWSGIRIYSITESGRDAVANRN